MSINAIVTIQERGNPPYVSHGRLTTTETIFRPIFKDQIPEIAYGYQRHDFEPNDSIVFIDDENNVMYPEKTILAWMPWPDIYRTPYQKRKLKEKENKNGRNKE